MVTLYEEEYFTKTAYQPYQDFPCHEARAIKIIQMTHPVSVLDIGCAYGYIVKKFLDSGIYAMGIDISSWCEQKAKEIIPNNFIRHDIRNSLPFRDKEFDVLYCEGVLEHIEEEYIIPVMQEFWRVSLRRILQISFSDHPEAKAHLGHVTLHDMDWWFHMIPNYTWLLISPSGIDGGNCWLYKG